MITTNNNNQNSATSASSAVAVKTNEFPSVKNLHAVIVKDGNGKLDILNTLQSTLTLQAKSGQVRPFTAKNIVIKALKAFDVPKKDIEDVFNTLMTKATISASNDLAQKIAAGAVYNGTRESKIGFSLNFRYPVSANKGTTFNKARSLISRMSNDEVSKILQLLQSNKQVES